MIDVDFEPFGDGRVRFVLTGGVHDFDDVFTDEYNNMIYSALERLLLDELEVDGV